MIVITKGLHESISYYVKQSFASCLSATDYRDQNFWNTEQEYIAFDCVRSIQEKVTEDQEKCTSIKILFNLVTVLQVPLAPLYISVSLIFQPDTFTCKETICLMCSVELIITVLFAKKTLNLVRASTRFGQIICIRVTDAMLALDSI